MLADPKVEVKSVLLRAAAIVRERGFTRDELEDDFGRVCLHAALYLAISDEPIPSVEALHVAAAFAVHKQLKSQGVDDYYTLPTRSDNWNSRLARSAEEVALVLENATQWVE